MRTETKPINKDVELIKPLTSLRFFAALAVVFAHFGFQYHTGGTGVAFFFILSGFILSYNYEDKVNNPLTKETFALYAMRLARIYPMHIVTLIASIPLWMMRGELPSQTATISNIFLAQSWYPSAGDYFSYNAVSWTLSIEWFFYLSFPFLIRFFKSYGLTTGRFKPIILSIASLALLICINLTLGTDAPYASYNWWLAKISPIHTFVFVTGIGLGSWFIQNHKKISISYATATALEISSLLLVSLGYALYLHSGINYSWGFAICFIPSFSLCIAIFAFSAGAISRLLSNRILVRLGEISFSTYMVHQLIINYFNEHLTMLMGWEANHYEQLSIVLLIYALSELCFRFIEEPARLWAKSRLRNRIRRTPNAIPLKANS